MDTKPRTTREMMKGIVQGKYGAPEAVLELAEIDRPGIDDDEVLVRIHAASIHIGEVFGIKGLPKVMRPIFAMTNAKNGVPGRDAAGTVEAVGKNVTQFRPGDEVFGSAKGAFAEFASTTPDKLARKPANLTFDQAATIGVSALTALQALRDHGKVEAGHKVLITGASGGVGTFAVQIAKLFGAEVTGVCSTRNLDMVRSIGADHVIDYTQTDFTRGDQKYDVILDNIGNHPLKDARRALTPNGILLANGAPISGWFGGLGYFLKAAVVGMFVKRQARPFVSLEDEEDLTTLKELAETGKITPVIDRTYHLTEAPAAIGHVGEGHAQGKTVITM